jgi:hypothetical protein
MNKNKARQATVWGASLVAISLAGIVPAAEIDASFRAGYAWTDNVARVAVGEVDEQIQSVGLTFDYVEETRKLDVLFQSSFDFLHYDHDTFDDDVIGGAIADLNYWLVEERLSWVLVDNYGQQLANPLAAATPDNLQNVNFLTTGPSMILPMSARNSLVTDLRFSSVDYEDLGLDNKRLSARVAFSRTLNDYATMSLNLRHRRIEFDDSLTNPAYDISDAFVRYESESPRNSIVMDVGFSQAEVGGQESDGYLLALSWERTLSPSWTSVFTGGSGYSDRAELFRELQNSGDRPGGAINSNGDGQPFRFDYLGVTYGLSAARTSTSFGFGWNSEDFELSPNLDRETINARMVVDRQLSRSFSVQALFEFSSRDYKTISRKDDDIRGQLSIRYDIGPSWLVSVQAQYNDRESTLALASYTENRYVLQFAYTPGWGR